jgi:hypothetical protein
VVTRREVVGLPVGGPTTVALVKEHLAITDDRDDARIGRAVDAVNRLVRCWPCSEVAVDAADWDDDSDVVHGATMLAARYFRRKNSPSGVEQVATTGPVYVARNDPEVSQLLQLGPWAPPSVG